MEGGFASVSLKIIEQIIAFAEHWMSHLRDQQLRSKMKQLYLQCAILRFMQDVYLELGTVRRVRVALGVLLFRSS